MPNDAMSGLRICKGFDLFDTLQYTMITVHHLNNSRSQRVLWLLEELGVPYEVTAADIQMSFPLEAANLRAGLAARRPKLVDFLSRIHARSAYQRALERGGPYDF